MAAKKTYVDVSLDGKPKAYVAAWGRIAKAKQALDAALSAETEFMTNYHRQTGELAPDQTAKPMYGWNKPSLQITTGEKTKRTF